MDNKKTELSNEVVKSLIKVSLSTLIMAVILFVAAGRLNWTMAWVYVALLTVNTVVISFLMDPELIVERSGFQEGMKRWDIVLVILMARVGPLSMLVVAGLDARFGWSASLSLAIRMAGLALAALGLIVTDWALLVNKFFSAVVRIQADRNHTVITDGPYRFVRHPGYLGAMLHYVGMPLMLGSLWTLIPTMLTIGVTVARTALEDKTLREELDGYREYTEQTRYRLLPGVW
jgi:protein-S-isoprenylcysteine O-methyltransferase Ste14